ncbi:hypothetical protein SAMN05444336_11293 [Albimonas donghaensis]|uniref:Uncharacterized protein n=1 Tax=Albimonas donghaensis TaxID=356660 RepID=A0A1H3FI13_9RHOB|nr:hypothetical protein [Albimonas donghaensis]SDX89759.1 hypothetical protein SAMN05444336_11293 [Albimonas donghaensis]
MNAPALSNLRRYAPRPAHELRAALGRLQAYREAFAASRPDDMPSIDAAIARHRALLDGGAPPSDRPAPEAAA